jgi:N-acetylmuramoyl-L-alanine amidase
MLQINCVACERHFVIVDRHRQDFNSVTEDQMGRVGAALAQLAGEGAWSRLYLRGGLGAGKTTLVRSILRALGVEGRIKSPSFAVAETYLVGQMQCAHLDLFRQSDPTAWRASGLREIFAESDLLLVEWPEKAAGLPAADVEITLDWADPLVPEGPRHLSIRSANDDLQARLQSALSELGDASLETKAKTPGILAVDPMRRSLTLAPVALAAALGLPPPARAVEVMAVRVWPAPNYTRVAIEHDTPRLVYTTTRLTRPERLVIDIQNLQLGYGLRQILAGIQPNDPFIAQVRVGQFKPHIVRMVFDLKQAIRAQVFTLPPIAQYQHRLVIDLYPEVEADPLLAFLREYEASRTTGAGTDQAPAPQTQAPAPVAPITPQAQTGGPGRPSAVPPQSAPNPPTAGTSRDIPSKEAPRASASRGSFITIAIDPGHGGEDPGAIGRGGTREKDVVLRIARELKRQIDAQPAMRAFLTRDGDFFVPLARRVALSRQVNADLFVSVHADAWVSPTAQGASVFALSDKGATSAAARWMANKENESDSIGGVKLGQADDLLTQTLLDMSTTAQIKYSLKLGQSVLREIGRVNRLHKPQVEQAGFAVLRAPDIPSILVETAFISNPEEERRLRDAAYQREVAVAMRRGIEDYLAQNPPLAKKARA